MATVVQLLASGIAFGFIYGLIAVGITLIWNAAGMLNFANGQVTMLSAYVFGMVFLSRLTMWPSVLAAIILTAAFGMLIAIVIFIPLRDMNRLSTIMATIMLGTILLETTRLLFGSLPLAPAPYFRGIVEFNGIVIARVYVYIIIAGVILAFALQLFLTRTKTGNAMRCVSQNKTAAALMGINVAKYLRYTAAMAFAISAIVGILIIPLFDLSLSMTSMVGLKGFAAAVTGGFGFLPGALAGGILIGLLENFGGLLISAQFKDAIAFIVLIIFLIINPRGLSGMIARDEQRLKGAPKQGRKTKVRD